MARPNIQLQDIQDVLRRAFQVAAKARQRRIHGHTDDVIADLEAVRSECDALPLSDNMKGLLLGEGLVRVHCALGRSYREIGNDAKATESYRSALDLDPENELTWFSLGGYYARLKKAGQLLNCNSFLDYASGYTKDPIGAVIGTGITYYMNDNTAEAERLWKSVLATDSQNKSARLLLAKMYYAQGFDGRAKQLVLPVLQNDLCPDCAALYLAASKDDEKDDSMVTRLKAEGPEIILDTSKKLPRDAHRIWALQQEMRKEMVLSDRAFKTVWSQYERSGVKPRPANEGAKAGIHDIRKRKPD